MTGDRVEKQIVLQAPRWKVWQALTDATQFAAWFGVEVEGEFSPGAQVWAVSSHPGYEGRFEMHLLEMVTGRRFSWQWHPGVPGRDYSAEPMTLVVFELEDEGEGTLLKVVESGFDALPAGRRVPVRDLNERGWAAQLKAIERYVG